MNLRRYKWWGLAFVLAMVIFGLSLSHSTKSEPVFYGRTFSSWFRECEIMPNASEDVPPSRAIREMGAPAVPYLMKLAATEDPAWLEFYDERYSSIPQWARRFVPEPRRRGIRQQTAMMILYFMGPLARPVAPEIIAAYDRAYARRYFVSLNHQIDWSEQLTNRPAALLAGGPTPLPESNFRLWALLTLAREGGDDKQIIPLLLCALHEPDNTFRSEAIYWLKTSTNLTSALNLSLPTVLIALADSNPVMRATATELLGTVVKQHPELVPPLMRAAEDQDLIVRQNALTALSRTHVDFDKILPLLGRLSMDEDSKIRGLAIRLLFISSGGGRLPLALTDALSSNDPAIRAAAAEAWRNFAQRAQAAIPKLVALTSESHEPDANVRLQALETLKIIAPDAVPK